MRTLASATPLPLVLWQSQDMTSNTKEELVFRVKNAKTTILSWKSHLLRSVNQDGARVQRLEAIDKSSVLIVQGWAKKYLPRKYRESQTDWFGKRGIPWQEENKNIHADVFAARDHLDVKIA